MFFSGNLNVSNNVCISNDIEFVTDENPSIVGNISDGSIKNFFEYKWRE